MGKTKVLFDTAAEALIKTKVLFEAAHEALKKWVVGAGHEAKIIQKEKGAQIETPGHGQIEIETPGKSPKIIAWKSLRGSGAPNLDKAR